MAQRDWNERCSVGRDANVKEQTLTRVVECVAGQLPVIRTTGAGLRIFDARAWRGFRKELGLLDDNIQPRLGIIRKFSYRSGTIKFGCPFGRLHEVNSDVNVS